MRAFATSTKNGPEEAANAAKQAEGTVNQAEGTVKQAEGTVNQAESDAKPVETTKPAEPFKPVLKPNTENESHESF